MKAWFTAAELAGLPGMPGTKQGVQFQARNQGWAHKAQSARGGQIHHFSLEALPDVTRLAIASRGASTTEHIAAMPPLVVARADEAGRQIRSARRTVTRDAGTADAANVTGVRAQERDDKLRLLVLLQRFWSALGGQLCPAVQAFCEAWNAGTIEATLELRARFPSLPRWRTVLEWHQALKNHGGAGLTRPASKRAGQFEALSGELGQTVLALMHDYPHLGAEQIRRLVEKSTADLEHPAALPSIWAFRRALSHWKTENAQLFAAVTNPDKWRSHYMSAAGSRSEGVGINDLWEQDGTKGEVMLADGQRWTITGNIDVGSRRLMVRLSASPRAAVVMSLTRQAIVTWGVPRCIKNDNGSDYTADQYELALYQLGIEHDLCDPFQPQQKPHIERALGTLLHDLFELLPGYLGHNVAQRSDIEARRSFAERLMKGTGEGGPVELRLQPEQLQTIIDNWLADYHTRAHGGMGEQSPNDVLAAWGGTLHMVDERALDIFLGAASTGGARTVGKKGIKLDNGWFNCAELGGLEGQPVQVKQTEADLGTCYVFDLAGRYIGTALDHSRLGVSAAEVAAERREHQKKVLARQKAELKAAVRAVKPQQLVMNVLQRKAEAAVDASPNVTRLRPTAIHTSDAIDSVVMAPATSNGISPAAAATLARMEAALAPRAPVLDLTKASSRYSHCVRLQARMAALEAVEARDLKWLGGYTATAEFKALDRLHQGSDPLAAEAGG